MPLTLGLSAVLLRTTFPIDESFKLMNLSFAMRIPNGYVNQNMKEVLILIFISGSN